MSIFNRVSKAMLISATVLSVAALPLVSSSAQANPVSDPVSSPAVLTAAQVKAKYGAYPLPVSVNVIKKHKLKKRHIVHISKAAKWAKGRKQVSVRKCESGNNYKTSTGNGYYGAWQFDRGTWRSNGGAKFGSTANKAPKWAQDYIAYKTWKSRGWQPWACA